MWRTYPSWNQFAWLYVFSLVAGSHGLNILWQGAEGWKAWLAGAATLVACAAGLRRWAEYLLTSTRALIRNGYTGRDIQTVTLDDIADITLVQGPVARFFNIGTLVIRLKSGHQPLLWQGVDDPEIVKTRLEAHRRGVCTTATGPSLTE